MGPRLALKYNVNIVCGQLTTPSGEDGLYNVATSFTATGRTSEQAKLHITPSEKRFWGYARGPRHPRLRHRPGQGRHLDLLRHRVPRGRPDRDAEGGADPLRPVLHGQPAGPPPRDALRPGPRHREPALRRDARLRRQHPVGGEHGRPTRAVRHLHPERLPLPARRRRRAQCEPNVETVVVADLDLETLRRNRVDGTVRPWRDRRLDLYEAVEKEPPPTPAPPRVVDTVRRRPTRSTAPREPTHGLRATPPRPRPDPAPPAACRAATTQR